MFSKLLDRMSFWSGVEALAVVIISFVALEWYLSKIPPEEGKSGGHVENWWFMVFGVLQLALQAEIEPNLDFGEALSSTFGDLIAGFIIFLLCYGALGFFGVDKDNKRDRVVKAFKGMIITTGLLCVAVLG